MIKIEMIDLQYEEPENLLAVAEYLQKIAKNNQERIDNHNLDTAFNTEVSNPETSDLLGGVNIPQSEVATIAELPEKLWPQLAGRVEREEFNIEEELIPVPPQTVVIPIPEPAAIFAKPQEATLPSVELDSQGMPWDFRIHARTKSKNKDGSWKRLRGVSNNTASKIESELKTVQEIPAAPVIPQPPEAPAMDFAAFMTLVTTAITAKKLERHEVLKVLDSFGIPSIPVAATRPDLIPGIIVELQAVINESK